MRKYIPIIGIITALTLACSPAFAADMPRGPVYKSEAPGLLNWSGFFVGVHGCGIWSTFNAQGFPTNANPTGYCGGVQTGFNYEFSNRWIAGVDASLSIGNIHDSILGGFASAKADLNGNARVKIGYDLGWIMPYGAAGIAFSRNDVTVTGVGTGQATPIGWTAGAGLEARLFGNWNVFAEYDFNGLGGQTYTITPGFSVSVKATEQVAKLGLNYRWGN